ncbi:MAG: efflux RND transporter periplasmic adaptor subunit [Thermodesulfobacteriota bacterium]
MNKTLIYMMLLSTIFTLILAPLTIFSTTYAESQVDNETEKQERGPKGGKLFRDGDFSIELTIFEQGVQPQFRVYAYENDKPVDPSKVNLSIELHRLDGEINRFAFKPENNVLIGDGVVNEPHSFDVMMEANYKGQPHRWEFESHEGRTEISEKAAQESGVNTEKAGAATISKYARLTGRITLNRNSTAQIRARFPGIVKSVNAMWGQQVKKGDVLAKVESNKSLNTFNVVSPVDGIIMARNTNVGDVAGDKPLFTIADLSEVWAEFHVFPTDLPNIQPDQMVRVYELAGLRDENLNMAIAPLKMLLPTANAISQTVLAIVPLDNKHGQWRPGMTVKGDVLIDEKQVPLAVKTSALQSFRDFTVVFAKVGNAYEVRMLELGMSDGEMVEVLSGLKPGTEYVTENSFLIKADIEKSGAGHDH